MNDEINKAIDEEILRQFKLLKTMKPGDDQFETVTESISKLYGLRSGEFKTECDFYNGERELNLKESESRPNKSRLIDWGLKICEIAIPTGASVFMWLTCLKFEENGSLGSPVSRAMIPRGKL